MLASNVLKTKKGINIFPPFLLFLPLVLPSSLLHSLLLFLLPPSFLTSLPFRFLSSPIPSLVSSFILSLLFHSIWHYTSVTAKHVTQILSQHLGYVWFMDSFTKKIILCVIVSVLPLVSSANPHHLSSQFTRWKFKTFISNREFLGTQ